MEKGNSFRQRCYQQQTTLRDIAAKLPDSFPVPLLAESHNSDQPNGSERKEGTWLKNLAFPL